LNGQYKMGSEEFAAKFNAGELGDDADWFEWQYLLDACQKAQRQLQLLEMTIAEYLAKLDAKLQEIEPTIISASSIPCKVWRNIQR